MPTFVSPAGNFEIWEDRPDGYMTVNEWKAKQPTAPTPTNKELFLVLRAARDVQLTATDKYMLADYPISEDNLALVKEYRAALRDLPEQPGAPWDGGGEATPWPIMPEV